MPDQSFWDRWGPLILTGAGTAANIYGARQGSNAVNQANANQTALSQQLLQRADQEAARRDRLSQLLMPFIARDMRAPRMLGQMMGAIGGPPAQPQDTGGGGGDPAQMRDPQADEWWNRTSPSNEEDLYDRWNRRE